MYKHTHITLSLSNQPSVNAYILSMPWLSGIMLQWTWGFRSVFVIVISSPLHIFLEVAFLSHTAVQFFNFWGLFILIPIMTVPIYIPTNSTQVFSFLHPHQHLLSLVYLIIAILTGVKLQYSVAFFYCLPDNYWDVAHLSSLEKISTLFPCPFLNLLFFFLTITWYSCFVHSDELITWLSKQQILLVFCSSHWSSLSVYFNHPYFCLQLHSIKCLRINLWLSSLLYLCLFSG